MPTGMVSAGRPVCERVISNAIQVFVRISLYSIVVVLRAPSSGVGLCGRAMGSIHIDPRCWLPHSPRCEQDSATGWRPPAKVVRGSTTYFWVTLPACHCHLHDGLQDMGHPFDDDYCTHTGLPSLSLRRTVIVAAATVSSFQQKRPVRLKCKREGNHEAVEGTTELCGAQVVLDATRLTALSRSWWWCQP